MKRPLGVHAQVPHEPLHAHLLVPDVHEGIVAAVERAPRDRKLPFPERCVECGATVWVTVRVTTYGVRCTVYGVRCTVYGARCAVSGLSGTVEYFISQCVTRSLPIGSLNII